MDGDARLIAAAVVNPVCLWCETGFEPRRGGSPQRFCNSKCRDAFHSAARRWAEMAVLGGVISSADLRNGATEAYMLLPAQERRSDYPDRGPEEAVLSDAQRASIQTLQLELSIRTYDEALATRETDPSTAAEVIIMQRLHERDIARHVLDTNSGDLVHVCLPMEFDERRRCVTRWGRDPRREDGELLWPE